MLVCGRKIWVFVDVLIAVVCVQMLALLFALALCRVASAHDQRFANAAADPYDIGIGGFAGSSALQRPEQDSNLRPTP
jgi:hypothetical protein